MERKRIDQELISSYYKLRDRLGDNFHNSTAQLEVFIKAASVVYPERSYIEYCDLALNFFRGNKEFDIPFTPKPFIEVCRNIIRILKPKRIYIPFADGSEVPIFTEDVSVDYKFLNKSFEKLANEYYSINSIDIALVGEYDLVLADLPLGPIYSSNFISGNIIKDSFKYLSKNGYAIFTLTKSSVMGAGKRWINQLKEEGLYLNAVFDMPINSYGFITQTDTVIAIFSKNKKEKLFVASLSEESVIDKIVENFIIERSSTTNQKMGIYIEKDLCTYSDYNDLCRIKSKYKQLEKNYNAELISVNELGRVVVAHGDSGFEEDKVSVFIPKVGNSDVVSSISEFQIRYHNYIQIIVDEDRILQRFLLYFFKTEDGKQLLQLYAKGGYIRTLNASIIRGIKVPCPTLDIQSEYLSTFNQFLALQNEVESLKAKFQKTPASYQNIRRELRDINNHEDKFIQWIECLPYPIATILKKYSVSDEYSKRQEMLLYFFEAYSIFESTILCSAVNKEIIDCSSLSEVDSSYFEKSSFGSWVKMDRVFSNIYLKVLNSPDKDGTSRKVVLSCFHTEDEKTIKYLCSKDVCNAIDSAAVSRNNWKGHSGITSELIYKEHVEVLESLLSKIRMSIKDLYERIRLIRPIRLRYVDGQFENKVEVLMGSNPIFVHDSIISLKPLDENKLYMQMLDTGDVLELPPYFILRNSPADVKNACYFYNRIEGGNTRYVSYHYEGRPEDMENGEEAFNIIKDMLTI